MTDNLADAPRDLVAVLDAVVDGSPDLVYSLADAAASRVRAAPHPAQGYYPALSRAVKVGAPRARRRLGIAATITIGGATRLSSSKRSKGKVRDVIMGAEFGAYPHKAPQFPHPRPTGWWATPALDRGIPAWERQVDTFLDRALDK